MSLGLCSVGAFTSTRHYALAYLGGGGSISLVVVIVFQWHCRATVMVPHAATVIMMYVLLRATGAGAPHQ